MLPLDRSQAMMTQEPRREDTQEFLERMWNIQERVDEEYQDGKEVTEDEGPTKELKGGGILPGGRHAPCSNRMDACY